MTSRSLYSGLALTTVALLVGLLGAHSAVAYKGIERWDVTTSTSQAGGHPDVGLNILFRSQFIDPPDLSAIEPEPGTCCENARVIEVDFPTGFIGNPHALPKCSLAELALDECLEDSQVGVINPLFGYTGVYNVQTHPDEAGLVSFQIPVVNVPAFLELGGRTESDYGLFSTSSPIYQFIGISKIEMHIWGVPADPSHDVTRLPSPLPDALGCNKPYPEPCYSPIASNVQPVPYLQNPTTCGGSLTAGLTIEYYDSSRYHADTSWPVTTGCDQLSFSPSLTAEPTTSQADTASGLDVDLRIPQPLSPTVPSQSQLRSAIVTLPEGFSINPNAADGKTACTEDEAAFGTRGPARCPEHAKVGTLEVSSSALPGPISGAIYLGEPLPGDQYRLFLTASGFATHLKLASSVHPDPETGQISTVFDDLPQSPLQRFTMHFFGSERGILATPPRCGTYKVVSEFEPWNNVLPSQGASATFQITEGAGGSPCPPQQRSFSPSFKAGSSDNTAGAHSPFVAHLDREDGEQTFASLNVSTPPGFSAVLKGIPYCPQGTLEAIASSSSGRSELSAPACPHASQIGTAGAGAGAGSRPLHLAGKVYLSGPYQGAPLSLAVITPAVSGPYDLGVVVVRAAIEVDPVTAQVRTLSDQIPQIIEGIPLRLRTVLVNLDRPDFAINPTNCDPFAVQSAIFGDQGAQANPSSHFQVANCASLPFTPKLSLKLSGPTKRRGHPALRATLEANPGEANLARAVVTLPTSTLLDNGSIGTPCTRVQFAADACPPESVYGQAEATTPLLDQPLKGPVYLRSSSNKLPDLVVALKGQIEIELAGRIDTTANDALRTSFETVPDAPITKFVLSLQGGPKGLLENREDLCKSKKRAVIRLIGQNGQNVNQRPRVQASCGSRAGARGHKRLTRARRVG